MRLNTFILPALIFLVILFLLLTRVTKISCDVDGNTCPDELQKNTSILYGKSFFFENFEKKLLQDWQTANSIFVLKSIQKKFPGTIILSFSQESVEYIINTDDKAVFVGNSGIAIPNQSTQDKIPKIEWKPTQVIVENNIVDERYNKIFLTIARWLNKLNKENIIINWLSDQEIRIEIPGQPPFIFDIQTIETQVQKIDTIINTRELNKIEEPILEIDMRFNLPVLRTRQ